MQKTKTLIAMILLVVLTIPTMIQVSQIAPAAAASDMPVYLKVYAEPNPTGVGQVVYISLFFTKPIPIVGAAGGASTYTGLSLNIVKPDGTNTTLGPYVSDTTGGVGGIEFTPATTGNYTVQAFYKGQTISGTVSGVTLTYNILATQSEAITFAVQQDPIQGLPLTALPSEYWSRPIYATNYMWSQLGGNWWGLGYPASDSENTTLYYNIQDYFYGQIDFQVRTILGCESEVFVSEYMENKPAYIGHMEPAIAFDAMSGWSGTQTATIPYATTETSPTSSASTPPIPTESVTPSQSPTATPIQPNTLTENPIGLEWEIVAFVILFVVVAVLVAVVTFQQRRLSRFSFEVG